MTEETERRRRLSDAYEAGAAGDRRTRGQRVAATHRPGAKLEALLALRETDRAAYDALPSGLKMALAYHAGAKAAAEAAGKETAR